MGSLVVSHEIPKTKQMMHLAGGHVREGNGRNKQVASYVSFSSPVYSFSHLHLSSHPLLHILQLSASCYVFGFSVFHCPSNEAPPGLNILVCVYYAI